MYARQVLQRQLSKESLAGAQETLQTTSELSDEALFKDPLPKEDCPICFLPMPMKMLSCMSLPPATTASVPIYDFANADEDDDIMGMDMEDYYECCGKSICRGCHSSFCESGNIEKCPFCKAKKVCNYVDKTAEVRVKELLKRVEVNDAGAIHQIGLYHYHGLGGFTQDKGRAMELWKQSAELGFTKGAMCVLGTYYYRGNGGLLQDRARAIELCKKAAALGFSKAHCQLGGEYEKEGYSKKAKFHYEAAAMAGHEDARHILGTIEVQSGNMERAVKHWKIAASAGDYDAMQFLILGFQGGLVRRDTIDSTLTAYNNSCAEMRSEARDAYIRKYIKMFNN